MARPLYWIWWAAEWEVQDFVWEHLAKDDVRVDPTTKQVAGEAVTWTVRVSSHLSDAEQDGEPGRPKRYPRGKRRTLTFARSTGLPRRARRTAPFEKRRTA